MPSFLVTRQVLTNQVVLVEAEDEEEAEKKAYYLKEGEIQHWEEVEILDVLDVER